MESQNGSIYGTLGVVESEISHNAKVITYADGKQDILISNRPIFGKKGWELREGKAPTPRPPAGRERKASVDIDRSQRRARARLRQLALSNQFEYFVTLTVNPSKFDSFDAKIVAKKTQKWLNNMVSRYGLSYILVSEQHKSGRWHWHGFVRGNLRMVDSNHRDKDGHIVYNWPQWAYGWSTAIALYGDYNRAVGYVCKYIGKDSARIGGRWYYSGGDLVEPQVDYVDLDWNDVAGMEGAYAFEVPGNSMMMVRDYDGEV